MNYIFQYRPVNWLLFTTKEATFYLFHPVINGTKVMDKQTGWLNCGQLTNESLIFSIQFMSHPDCLSMTDTPICISAFLLQLNAVLKDFLCHTFTYNHTIHTTKSNEIVATATVGCQNVQFNFSNFFMCPVSGS